MQKNKRILRILGAVLLFFVLFQVLLDPLSRIQYLGERWQARIYLPTAREKWEAQGIRHYRFDIQGYVPLVCMFSGGIEVKDGLVISGPRSDTNDPQVLLFPGFSRIKDPLICNYQNYTMPLLFDEIEGWLQNSPSSITQISFELQYGFVSSFNFGDPGGRGLLNPIIFDCCGGFTIENFQVLE